MTITPVTKTLAIADERYTIIRVNVDGKTLYGTIPHSNIDENGNLIEGMNGLQMALRDTIANAIDARRIIVETRGMREDEMISYIIERYRKNHKEI